jgi:hypothetical protein
MKLTVNEIIKSDAYTKEAEAWAKAAIFLAFSVALYVAIFTDISLGWNWLWVVPALLFGASLLLAMPAMYVQVWLASEASPHMSFIPGEKPRPTNPKGRILNFIKAIWCFIVIPIQIWIVFEFLKFVGN